MITEVSDKKELLTAIHEPVPGLLNLMSALDENKSNRVPYKDSRTAGQLFRHVAKSTSSMAKARLMESKPADRNAGEKAPELKKCSSISHTK